MNEHAKLQSREQEHSTEAHLQQTEPQPLEFATVEDLLRHDAGQNPVPPAVAERLSRSLADQPAERRPWYKRLLG